MLNGEEGSRRQGHQNKFEVEICAAGNYLFGNFIILNALLSVEASSTSFTHEDTYKTVIVKWNDP